MKKSLLTFFAYFFFLLLSFTTIGVSVSAQEDKKTPDEKTTVKKIEYTLPYPGILPDHPLYSVKALRDKIMGFLIRDPLKKTEFNILMSDKRVIMGTQLIEKDKTELADKTLNEANDFYLAALAQAANAKKQGREISNDLKSRLTNSLAKHKEVLTEFKEKVPENYQEGYKKILELVNSAEAKLQEVSK